MVTRQHTSVLIPILMDYPLGAYYELGFRHTTRSLNPYSNGLPSRGRDFCPYGVPFYVLIPILMDYPLGVFARSNRHRVQRGVLIPILMDYPLGARKCKQC